MHRLQLTTLPAIPEIVAGDDIAGIVSTALDAAGEVLQAGDVLVIAQKIVSKAEGRFVNLATVEPSARALELAQQTEKDARLVELILREAQEVSRQRPGLIIVRHRLGFISANAGIDRSNVAQEGPGETVLLLPEDPDRSARAIRDELGRLTGVLPGVIINDSHGRPHRLGTVGVAIGVAGLPPLLDRRGVNDRYGYELQHTVIGVADEIAAAASILMGAAAEGTPLILVRGLQLPPSTATAADLYRPLQSDLYR